MDVTKLSKENKQKFIELAKLMEKEFGVVPPEMEVAINEVEKGAAASKAYGAMFVKNYVLKRKDSYEMFLDIYGHMKQGLGFNRAVAKTLCRW